MRHLLDIDDLERSELEEVLELAQKPDLPHVLAGRGVALVFEKPSARTRNATEMAVVQLGGHPITIRDEEVGFDTRESVEDITRTLACFHAAVAARVHAHRTLERMVALDVVPIINLLSNRAHPMQALADVLTLRQEFGNLDGRTLAWVGDTNNVCRSLTLAACMLGMNVRIAPPPEYEFTRLELDELAAAGAVPLQVARPEAAVEGADAVVTDTWVSMGQEAEAGERHTDFEGFTVDEPLMRRAAGHAVFLHCLPAHRGQEVTDAVLDGPQSRVWREAENRMHTARAALAWLVG
ncbi:MAG TPA: ornithine carbamoyltransferase [Acidimicrobiales bacterium]|jgi:ornithine carbamoyltransferase|nr:ornithine carbamoyltransferase [Acidimicrobiales bacterium]